MNFHEESFINCTLITLMPGKVRVLFLAFKQLVHASPGIRLNFLKKALKTICVSLLNGYRLILNIFICIKG